MTLAKPVLLVTGGSRGIGAATAIAGASRGYPVSILYRSRAADAETLLEAITAAGGEAIAVQADVSREDDVARAFAKTEQALGPVGALVNSAGVTGGISTLPQVSRHQIDEAFATNVTGTFLCVRELARRLATRPGMGASIVNVSSRASLIGAPGVWVHYAATKGAVDTMTIGMAKELTPAGIRVNAVRPGVIDTDIHEQRTDGSLDRMLQSIPMKRMGKSEEVGAAILWLLSDEASYVSGAILDVAGGA